MRLPLYLLVAATSIWGPCTQLTLRPQSFSATAMTFSESSLSRLQVEVRKALKEGKVSADVVTCVGQLPASSFAEPFEGLLREILEPAELKVADAFWSSTAGKKYARQQLARFYTQLGEPLPGAIPQFSEQEITEVRAFSETSAGEKLMLEKALESQFASRAVLARRIALLASCDSR